MSLMWISNPLSGFNMWSPIHKISRYQASSRLHKTVIDYDYDYFQFMRDDYDYIFTSAHGITITIMIIHFFKF